MQLRRPVVAWLTWLVIAYGGMAAAAWTSPDPWEIGAYTRALAIMSPHWWSLFWAAIAVAAAWALICRCAWSARAACVLSIGVQLPWAVSVAWEGVALRHPWAYVPAALVWLAPAAGSAATLLQPLSAPVWPVLRTEE